MTTNAKAEDVLQVAAGDVVAGKYRVDRVLGQGAMGIVVAARHEELGQKVAIKLLHPDVSVSDDGRERFLREARAAAKLESDHVARVFDVGTFGNKNAYMVMEYLEGSDLEKYLDAHGPLPFDEAVDYVLEALEALAHAHAHGMVHRDIKPSNLFLTQRIDGTQRVKILDFGISKTESGLGVSSPGSSTLTSPQAVLGSPAYMAPEQIRSSKHVDQRADIWSVGVLLYELVTGKSPFLGQSVGDTLARVIACRPEPLKNIRPDAPPELVETITRCLEIDEKDRFQNVAELAQSLAPLASRNKDLPRRIARVLVAHAVAPPPRAIVPSDSGVRVNVAAETLAAEPETNTAKGTQITATSSGLSQETTRPSRSWLPLAGFVGVVAFVLLFLKLRPDTEPPASPTSELPAPAVENQPKHSPSAFPTTPTTASPQIVPVVTPEASVQAMPEASAMASARAMATNSADPLPAVRPSPSASKKTSPTSNPTYPSGLLDGRD
ncbi:MAG TPA: protein kinase [Polyangium sp.]|nr:protein kinase [Polyangium sp.]